MKNKLIPNNYLFHFEEINFNEFNELKKNISNKKYGPINYRIIPQKKMEEFNNLVPNKINPCFKNVKSYQINIRKFGFNRNNFCNTIYLSDFGRQYFKIRIEHVYAFNNTDPSGPKVQNPISQSDDLSEYILDEFRKFTAEEFNAASNNVYSSYLSSKSNKGHYPVIAILDTGIDLGAFKTELDNDKRIPLHYYKNPCKSKADDCCCENQDEYVIGHNFYNEREYGKFPNHPYDNDGFTKHGTRIAKLIAKITENKVRLMTLKTANYRGQHELYDIYCAFEYVLKYNESVKDTPEDKVKIINASWSFKSECRPLIFEYYLQKLIADGVTFVTTAGNENKIIGTQIQLYPAIFKDSNDILVVGDNSGKHGYSDVYVNCCVNGDKSGHYKDVLLNKTNDKLFGTSFAAAIYSGYLIKSNFGPGTMVGSVSTLNPTDYSY